MMDRHTGGGGGGHSPLRPGARCRHPHLSDALLLLWSSLGPPVPAQSPGPMAPIAPGALTGVLRWRRGRFGLLIPSNGRQENCHPPRSCSGTVICSRLANQAASSSPTAPLWAGGLDAAFALHALPPRLLTTVAGCLCCALSAHGLSSGATSHWRLENDECRMLQWQQQQQQQQHRGLEKSWQTAGRSRSTAAAAAAALTACWTGLGRRGMQRTGWWSCMQEPAEGWTGRDSRGLSALDLATCPP